MTRVFVLRSFSFLLLLVASVGALQAQTDDEQSLVLTTGGWPPFLAEDLQENGFIAHLITDIFAEHDIEVEYRFMPWARAYQEAASGSADGTAVWMDQADRHEDFLYSDPVLEETFVFFHLEDKTFDWSDFEDLQGLLMGGVYGYSYGTGFDRAKEKGLFEVDWVSDEHLNLQKLLRGRIDLYPQEVSVGQANIQAALSPEEAERIVYHPRPLHNDYSFLLISRAHPQAEELVQLFNETLEAFRASGRYDAYFDAFAAGEYEVQ